MWSRKILHRNGSGTITLNRKMMEDAGWSGVESVNVEIGSNGVVTMRPAASSVLVTISGKPCYTWEEAAWAVEAERAKEQEALYAEDDGGAVGAQNADEPENE